MPLKSMILDVWIANRNSINAHFLQKYLYFFTKWNVCCYDRSHSFLRKVFFMGYPNYIAMVKDTYFISLSINFIRHEEKNWEEIGHKLRIEDGICLRLALKLAETTLEYYRD